MRRWRAVVAWVTRVWWRVVFPVLVVLFLIGMTWAAYHATTVL